LSVDKDLGGSNAPVILLGNGEEGNRAGVKGIIDTSENQSGLVGAVLVVKIETEDVAVELALLHDVIEEGEHVVGSHRRIGQTDNTIEGRLSEDGSNFVDDFGKVLGLDFNSSDVSVIGVNFSLELASSEFDIEVESELLVCGVLGSVVLLMVFATSISALGRVDPDVCAS
jgi:hypothetical protein